MTKALTLHQPWASLVALGVKRIETRSWATKYRGRLLIHAGLTYRPLHCDAPEHDHEWWSSGSQMLIPPKDAEHADEWQHGNPFRPVPLGAIVASCTLADCVPMVDREAANDEARPPANREVWLSDEPLALANWDHGWDYDVIEDQRPYGDFAPGRFAWLLEEIEALAEPIPCKGRQGLWTPDQEVLDALGA